MDCHMFCINLQFLPWMILAIAIRPIEINFDLVSRFKQRPDTVLSSWEWNSKKVTPSYFQTGEWHASDHHGYNIIHQNPAVQLFDELRSTLTVHTLFHTFWEQKRMGGQSLSRLDQLDCKLRLNPWLDERILLSLNSSGFSHRSLQSVGAPILEQL